MPNSLRAKFDSMRYKGRIDEAEYQALIKKLDGHDKQIRADAIEEFETRILGNCASMLKDGERVIVIRQDIFQFISEQMQKGKEND